MYCYCIEKSEIKKRSANKNGSHFEKFWGCLQVFVLWGLAGKILLINLLFHRKIRACIDFLKIIYCPLD